MKCLQLSFSSKPMMTYTSKDLLKDGPVPHGCLAPEFPEFQGQHVFYQLVFLGFPVVLDGRRDRMHREGRVLFSVPRVLGTYLGRSALYRVPLVLSLPIRPRCSAITPSVS